jgi:hypothetical protein
MLLRWLRRPRRPPRDPVARLVRIVFATSGAVLCAIAAIVVHVFATTTSLRPDDTYTADGSTPIVVRNHSGQEATVCTVPDRYAFRVPQAQDNGVLSPGVHIPAQGRPLTMDCMDRVLVTESRLVALHRVLYTTWPLVVPALMMLLTFNRGRLGRWLPSPLVNRR